MTSPPVTAPDAGPRPATRPAGPVMAARDYALIGLQSMLWGSAFFFISLAGSELPPATMSALRLLPACLILLTVTMAMGLRLPATWGTWGRMVLMSAFNNVFPFILIIYAQREVTGGIAAIFNATAPLFAVFLSAVFVPEETLSWRRVLGIAAGIGGVAILVSGKGAGVSLTAASLMLVAASFYATGNVMARLFFPGFPPFVIACSQMMTSLFLATLVALALDQPWTLPVPSTRTLLATLAMGTFGSAFASLCHFTVLRRAGPTNAMLVTIILPLTPLALGFLVFGQTITPQQALGGLVIALALVIIDGRLWARLVRRPARTTP